MNTNHDTHDLLLLLNALNAKNEIPLQIARKETGFDELKKKNLSYVEDHLFLSDEGKQLAGKLEQLNQRSHNTVSATYEYRSQFQRLDEEFQKLRRDSNQNLNPLRKSYTPEDLKRCIESLPLILKEEASQIYHAVNETRLEVQQEIEAITETTQTKILQAPPLQKPVVETPQKESVLTQFVFSPVFPLLAFLLVLGCAYLIYLRGVYIEEIKLQGTSSVPQWFSHYYPIVSSPFESLPETQLPSDSRDGSITLSDSSKPSPLDSLVSKLKNEKILLFGKSRQALKTKIQNLGLNAIPIKTPVTANKVLTDCKGITHAELKALIGYLDLNAPIEISLQDKKEAGCYFSLSYVAL